MKRTSKSTALIKIITKLKNRKCLGIWGSAAEWMSIYKSMLKVENKSLFTSWNLQQIEANKCNGVVRF